MINYFKFVLLILCMMTSRAHAKETLYPQLCFTDEQISNLGDKVNFIASFYDKALIKFKLKIGSTMFYQASKNEQGEFFDFELKFVPICQTLANHKEVLSVGELYKVSISNSEYKEFHDRYANTCKKYLSKKFNAANEGVEIGTACEYHNESRGEITYSVLKRINGSSYIIRFNRIVPNLDISKYTFEDDVIKVYRKFLRNLQISSAGK